MNRFFHTVVVLGLSATSGCADDTSSSDDASISDDATMGADTSHDAQDLADRVIEDAETMRDALPDARKDLCRLPDGGWDEDSCPLIR